MIYLDYNATAPMRPVAVDAVAAAAVIPGNASSPHRPGQGARRILDDARDAIRALVGASGARIILTSGGTEADNLAICGLARRRARDGARVLLISDLEHPAVGAACAQLESEGFSPRKVHVAKDGRVDMDVFPAADELRKTVLIAVMLANNETGVIQPVAEICAIARAATVPVHVDAVQGAGKIPIDFNASGASSLAISAHKFGGPRGIGALVLGEDVEVEPLWGGGGQEDALRSGSQAVALASGMAAAARAALAEVGGEVGGGVGRELPDNRLLALRDRLEGALRELPGAFVNGADAPRLPNTCSIGFAGIGAQDLVARLNREGILIGAGAACHGDEVRISAVLSAMGLADAHAASVVRVSLGFETTPEEIDRSIVAIGQAVEELVP